MSPDEIDDILRCDREYKKGCKKEDIEALFSTTMDMQERKAFLADAMGHIYTELFIGNHRYGYCNRGNGTVEFWRGGYLSARAKTTLENIPMDTQILEKWLKCGYVETQKLFPTDEGTPQGGTISPTLMNMTLDGLERLLHDRLPTRKKVNGKTHCNKMNFVRYADDFIITGESPEFLREKVLPIVREFLTERGLQLSEEKTVITHIGEGFDFLGKNIRKYNGKLLIKPCKSAVKSFLGKVRDIIKSSKSIKQEILIRRLNPVIRGWVNNQRYVVSSKVFSTVDYGQQCPSLTRPAH